MSIASGEVRLLTVRFATAAAETRELVHHSTSTARSIVVTDERAIANQRSLPCVRSLASCGARSLAAAALPAACGGAAAPVCRLQAVCNFFFFFFEKISKKLCTVHCATG